MQSPFVHLSALLLIALSTAVASAADHVKTVSLEVGDFAVVDAGEGPAVVLMHGFPDTKEVWQSQIEALSQAGYRVIAPDMRGRGESWSPLEVELYTLDKIQQDVLDIMDTLEVDEAHLVGHDWGALMAWNLAASHAERFHSVTVVSIGHPSSPAFSGFPELASSWYIYLFLQEGLAEQTLASYDWEFFRQLAFLRKDIDDMIARLSGPNQLTTGLNYYRANLQGFLAQPGMEYPIRDKKPPQPEMTATTLPVLGIWGAYDRALTEQPMLDSYNVVDDYTYVRFNVSSHWPMLDEPEKFSETLLGFFKKHD